MWRTIERMRHEGLYRFGLREDKTIRPGCVSCIMIAWVETASTPPFIG
jgi:hypothetical protein